MQIVNMLMCSAYDTVSNSALFSAEMAERVRPNNASSPGIRMLFKSPPNRTMAPLDRNVSQLCYLCTSILFLSSSFFFSPLLDLAFLDLGEI